MTKEQAIQKLIDLAVSQIGYKEPNGDNHNKYAHEMDTTYKGWFNGSKDGYDWCAVFVNWLFVTAFGVDVASKMLNHSSKYGTMSAVVQYLYRSLMEVNRVGKEPHVGDIVFYHNDKYEGLSQLCHVGIVWKVNGDYITTIEGNSGRNSDSVATREIRKNYDTKSWGIYGFGYPDYSAAGDEPVPDPKTMDGYTVGERYKVICKDTLNVRTKAEVSRSSKIVTKLNPGTEFTCEALTHDSKGNTWMRIKSPAEGWVCCIENGDRYVGSIEPTPKTLDGYTVGRMYTVDAKAGLWERKTPTTVTDSNKVKVLKYGTVVMAKDLKKVDGNTWMQIADGNWVAAHYRGDRFVE